MKLGRASRKLSLVTLPSTLPVGLKRALMRSRKKYLKQQKYTPSMKINSFLDLSEERGCARDYVSHVLAGYFEKSSSWVLFCLLFCLLLLTDLSKSLLNQNTLQTLSQVGDSYFRRDNLGQQPKSTVQYPQWFNHHLKGCKKPFPLSLKIGRGPEDTSGVGFLEPAILWLWTPIGFAFQTYSWTWGDFATNAREVPAHYGSMCARAAKWEAFGSVPWQRCTQC